MRTLHPDYAGNTFRIERVEPFTGTDTETGQRYWLYRFRTEGGTGMGHTHAFRDEDACVSGRMISRDYHARNGISAAHEART